MQQTATASAQDIAANLRTIQARVAHAAAAAGRPADSVTIVAVSKTFPADLVTAAHQAGVRHFGENWVQEAAAKLPQLAALTPRPIWHMVGHLQTNKVKLALELFDLIQSVDSVHLGETIARRADGRCIPILLEVNVAGEASKQGFRPEDLPSACDRLRAIPQLDLRGLMTVAPAVDHPEAAEPVFRCLRELRDELGLQELSMGMTDDFEVAVREGATILRIGRAIFGPRSYP